MALRLLAALALLVFCSGHAQAQLGETRCQDIVLKNSKGLEAPALSGHRVRPAIKQRCTTRSADPDDYQSVEYFSPVYLTAGGFCKFVAFDEKRNPDDTIFVRERGGRCPAQGRISYTETKGISDNDYLALNKFWVALRASGKLPVQDVIARMAGATDDPGYPDDLRQSLVELQNELPILSARLNVMDANSNFSEFHIPLSQAEERLPKFKVTVNNVDMFLVRTSSNLEIVAVSVWVP